MNAIYQEVVKLFEQRTEGMPSKEYRDLCGDLMDEFQTKYELACEEVEE